MHKHQRDITQQETMIPVAIQQRSFHDYLGRHHLSWHEVAHAAGVPALVVWSIDHQLAVSAAHAAAVRAALVRLTNTPFTGSIQVIDEGKEQQA